MLTIRLQRTGKKNQADFRIVLAEKESPVKKKFLEVLGSYNPRKKDFRIKEERAKYWIGQRIEMSPTVHNLFVTKGLLQGAKVKAFNTPKKPVESAPAPESAVAEKSEAPVAAPTEATPEVKVEVVVSETPETPAEKESTE
jgi:small subunit ribosomal protein S16